MSALSYALTQGETSAQIILTNNPHKEFLQLSQKSTALREPWSSQLQAQQVLTSDDAHGGLEERQPGFLMCFKVLTW